MPHFSVENGLHITTETENSNAIGRVELGVYRDNVNFMGVLFCVLEV